MSLWIESHRLVLASGSPTRRKLLAAAGLPFTVMAASVDERGLEAGLAGAAPEDIAAALACAKALAADASGALVVGADQVLSLDGRILHKSPDRATALATLGALQGRTHRLTSAFAIARDGKIVAADADHADMTMRPLGLAALGAYLDAAGEGVFGSVGVYHWEGVGAHLFERISGDHATILGLPMLKLLAALRRLGALAF